MNTFKIRAILNEKDLLFSLLSTDLLEYIIDFIKMDVCIYYKAYTWGSRRILKIEYYADTKVEKIMEDFLMYYPKNDIKVYQGRWSFWECSNNTIPKCECMHLCHQVRGHEILPNTLLRNIFSTDNLINLTIISNQLYLLIRKKNPVL